MNRKEIKNFEYFKKLIFTEYLKKDFFNIIPNLPKYVDKKVDELLEFCLRRIIPGDEEDLITTATIIERFIGYISQIDRKEGEESWRYPNRVGVIFKSITRNQNLERKTKVRKVFLEKWCVELLSREEKSIPELFSNGAKPL